MSARPRSWSGRRARPSASKATTFSLSTTVLNARRTSSWSGQLRHLRSRPSRSANCGPSPYGIESPLERLPCHVKSHDHRHRRRQYPLGDRAGCGRLRARRPHHMPGAPRQHQGVVQDPCSLSGGARSRRKSGRPGGSSERRQSGGRRRCGCPGESGESSRREIVCSPGAATHDSVGASLWHETVANRTSMLRSGPLE